MIIKPTVTDLLKVVIATSKRARQIASGSPTLTNVKEKSEVTLAANEIASGKVGIVRC